MVLRRDALAVLLSAACSWACSESDAGVRCDAGEQCGRCLLLVNASACSSMSYHGNTKCSVVERGEMCEGDGECGSDDNANNCATPDGKEPLKDVYLRVRCRGDLAAPGGSEEPGAGIREDLRSASSLLVASVLCGWLLMHAWRKAHLRPSASLAAADGAGGVQLDAMPEVPVGRAVLVPLAEVQVPPAQPAAEVEGQEEAEEAEAQAAHGSPVLEPESTESTPPNLAEAAAKPTEASGSSRKLAEASGS
jgi:hypothetical protein